ncbi:retrotransposon protein, putative, Ty3-gypsy subclass [Panicum miliaceum]|uniref:Retrotransposon protein, putative, Ty3-gypsy subclass n=1 Tax=Panicum miliaceum TaxID=4540 RepID=A0A3L6RQ31_PANMI|nr:retrotransposon protein, putative, Ty3-gypsy subclass [Panicum miliaceum]
MVLATDYCGDYSPEREVYMASIHDLGDDEPGIEFDNELKDEISTNQDTADAPRTKLRSRGAHESGRTPGGTSAGAMLKSAPATCTSEETYEGIIRQRRTKNFLLPWVTYRNAMPALYPRAVVLPEVIPTPATIDKSSRRYSSKALDPGEGGNLREAKATRDQEDEENERFPKRKNDKGNNNNNRPDKGQYSGTTRKRKPKDQVANIERNPCSKKSGKLQDQYEKILHKQCPMHPKAKHTMFQCTVLRKSLNALPPPDDEKDKDKVDKDNDKSGPSGFQHPTKIVNVIFRGEDGFLTNRAQKMFWREIMSVEPAVSRLLRHSKVPISFSREDQWTSFSEPGKLSLVLDPVLAGSTLTRVLIDGGSGLDLLFPSTLKKMRLDIGKMLTPSKASFYGILSDMVHYSSEERKVINDLVSNTLYFFTVLVELLFGAFPGDAFRKRVNIHAWEV